MSMRRDELGLLDLWNMLRDGWLLLAGIVTASIIASVAIALWMPPVFRAEIVITPVNSNGDNGSSGLLGRLGSLAGIAGISLGNVGGSSNRAWGVLHSRALLEEFIQRHDLIPVLFAASKDDSQTPPPTLWRAVELFERVYDVERDPESGLITVRVEWTDAQLAANWANDLVKLANEVLRQQDLADAKRNIEYLNQQISQTNVVELQQVAYNLIEAEMNTLMLASAREEYAFAVIDPAVAPELRARPKRKQIVVLGALFGGVVAVCAIALRQLVRNLRAQEKRQS